MTGVPHSLENTKWGENICEGALEARARPPFTSEAITFEPIKM